MIKAGNIVFLNSGIYPMTVESVNNNIARCIWLNHRDEIKVTGIPVQMLTEECPIHFRFTHYANTEYPKSDYPDSMGNYEYDYELTHDQPFEMGLIVKVKSHPTMMTVQEVKEDNRIICAFFNKYGDLKKVSLPRILLETYKRIKSHSRFG